MATLLNDRLEDAEEDIGEDYIKVVRYAIVKDLDTTQPFGVLNKALTVAGMPQRGDQHPIYTDATVRRHRVRVLKGAQDQAQVWIYYESGGNGGFVVAGKWLVRETSSLVQIGTTRTADGQTIVVKYSTSGDPNASDANKDVPTVPKFQPARTLTAFRTSYEKMSDTIFDSAGFMNSREFRGKPRGYWLAFGADHDPIGNNQYRQTVTMIGRNETWFEFANFRQENGKVPTLPPIDVPTNLALPPAGGQTQGLGLTLAGIYGEIDFNDRFPFMTGDKGYFGNEGGEEQKSRFD
jgi:hypothetical protein